MKIDGRNLKCCFSSTMKRNMIWTGLRERGGVLALASALAAMWLSGCASPGGSYESASEYNASPPRTAGGLGSDARTKVKAEQPRQKAAEERPGLATGFGEQTKSLWNRQSFVRATPLKPAGTGVTYYNDKEGIDAMSGYRHKVDPVRSAAGEMLEWGIKGGFSYLPTYVEGGVYGGKPRAFVVGSRDSNYSIVLKNRCKSRLEVVLSVDGLDVIDGNPAGFSKRGYVIGSGETLEVKGWRTSPETVARFNFSTVSGSHANLTHGDHRNVGVIGLAVFTEEGVDPWTWMPREVDQRINADPFARKL